MAGRHTKRLIERVRENTFRADKNGKLLDTDTLSETPLAGWRRSNWEKLRGLQLAYRALDDKESKHKIALQFGETLRAIHAHRPDSLTFPEIVYAGCGPGKRHTEQFRRADGTIDWERFGDLRRAWAVWNWKYGVWYRAAYHELGNPDEVWWYQLLTGDHEEHNLKVIEAKLDYEKIDLYVEAFREHSTPAGIIPAPPEPNEIDHYLALGEEIIEEHRRLNEMIEECRKAKASRG